MVVMSSKTVSFENLDCIDNIGGRLKPEIEKWCRSNLRAPHEFHFADHPPSRHTVRFENDEDAVLFKMRWIG
jgi:hypothetical protein